MQISIAALGDIPAGQIAGPLVLGVAEEGKLTGHAARLDKALKGALTRAMHASRFKGQAGRSVEVLAPEGLKVSRIILSGLGKGSKFDTAGAEKLAALAVGRFMTSGEATVSFALEVPAGSKLSEASLAAHLALGAHLRSYRFDAYRTQLRDDVVSLKSVTIASSARAAAEKQWAELSAVAEGVELARNLVNEPPNVLYPDEFAKRMKALTKLGAKVEVLNTAEMKKLGMNLLLGVAQGSEFEPRLVVIRWDGGKAKQAPIAFVGKGVCFDSGGLSLKPAASMMGMKGDMGGAAAVAGLMHALAKRKARVNAVGVLGLVENMPDGKAQRPNDVVTSMSGQTVEVLNTDAEGRLVLGDALWYTQSRFKPKFMINLATLTGAIMVALGAEYAGLFSNDDELSKRLARAGEAEGELVWRMPLGEAYDKLIRSPIADMKNIGGQYAGSITAAQFLQRFTNKVPWAHLDIAGVAWQDGEKKPLSPSWGTGWGVRLLNRLVADHYEN